MNATKQSHHEFRERFFKRLGGIPAGILLLPLLLGSLIHTFLPGALEIGSFTTALFSSAGTATLMALQLFCIGTQIRLNSVSGVLRRGGVLLLSRVAASARGANAIAVPAAIALSNPTWQQIASTAAAQIGVPEVIGAVLVPMLAQWWSRRKSENQKDTP